MSISCTFKQKYWSFFLTNYDNLGEWLKITCLEFNLSNTNTMLKKWGRLYANGGKNEDTWHHLLSHDKHLQGVRKLG